MLRNAGFSSGHSRHEAGPAVSLSKTKLQNQGQELLREYVERFRWRDDGFCVPVEPELQPVGRSQESVVRRGQEETVASRSGSNADSRLTARGSGWRNGPHESLSADGS